MFSKQLLFWVSVEDKNGLLYFKPFFLFHFPRNSVYLIALEHWCLRYLWEYGVSRFQQLWFVI